MAAGATFSDPLGDSHLRAHPDHRGDGGLVDLSQTTFESLLEDVLYSLVAQRFRRLVIWRGCGGHQLRQREVACSAPGGLRRLRVVRAFGLRFMLTFQIAIDSGKDLRRIVQPISWFPR